MSRFYIAQKISGEFITITDEKQVHYIRNVLRLKIGEKVFLFDAGGNEFQAKIARISKDSVEFGAIIRQDSGKSPGTVLAVACAIPKRTKFDEIVDKLTQLGVTTIIPLLTERTLVKADVHGAKHLSRWNRIAMAASEQSQRSKLPVITGIMTFQEVIKNSEIYQVKLIATLQETAQPVKKVIENLSISPQSIIVLIGPEGDFSSAEVIAARSVGFTPVSLGRLVLRVETAAIALAGYLRFSLED